MERVITEPEQATPEWLSEMLGLSITAVTAATRIGTGQMSRNFRLDLVGDGPASVVIKIPAAEPGVRELGASAYTREVAFYRSFAEHVLGRVPACHHLAISESAQEFTLILEDLSPATQGNQIEGCTISEAELSLRNLARCHAPLWDHPMLSSTPPFDAEEDTSLIAAFYPVAHTQFLERYSESLAEQTIELLSIFADHAATWQSDRPGPLTLVHADYRLDNLLFTADGVAAVDWQTITVASGARDVAYFLGNGLPTERRREHEAALLEVYLQELQAGGVDYDMAALRTEYARGAWLGPYITVLGAFASTRTDRGDEMFIVMANRAAAQLADHDAVSLLGT